MKSAIICFLVLAFCSLAVQAIIVESWETYKQIYDKKYSNIQEEIFRKNLFLKALKMVKEHNEKYDKGLIIYKLGINQFSDMTEEETNMYTASSVVIDPEYISTLVNATMFVRPTNFTAPEAFDWREQGVVSAVKSQKNCGSCWAFSTTGSVESQYAIRQRKSLSLSEQELLDCDTAEKGCGGGHPDRALSYVQNNGLMLENEYPYRAVQGQCQAKPSQYKVSGHAFIQQGDEEDLKAALVMHGPISVAMNVDAFHKYTGEIYVGPCGPELNHAVLAVGYGTENGQDYWLIKNSWGTEFGDNGYMKVARNNNNHCGIGNYAVYPILN